MAVEDHRSKLSRVPGRPAGPRSGHGARLTWTLVGAAMSCAGVAAWLVFGAMPATRRDAANTSHLQTEISTLQVLVAGEANDERGYLLSGDPIFLSEFNAKQRQVEPLLIALTTDGPPRARTIVADASFDYRRFLADHTQVVAAYDAGNRALAAALDLNQGRRDRKAAQAEFPGANDDMVASAKRQAAHEATQTNTAGGALFLLGLALLVAAVEVTRRLRRERANAGVLRDSQEAVVLLEALAVSANEAVTIDAALQVCLDRVCEYTGWLVGHAYVSDGEQQLMSSPIWHLDRPDRFRATRVAAEAMKFKFGEGAVGRAFATGRPSVCRATDAPVAVPQPTDTEAIASRQRWATDCAGLVDMIVLPIVVDGSAMAVLEFFSSTLVVLDDQLGALMANVTAQLARVLERDRAAAQLIHQTLHDPLTGLANRVLLSDRLAHALARLSRQLHPMAVLFVDVDNFKVINDSLGHDRGDRILVKIAERLANAVRSGDTVARFGGDEFVILCEQLVGETEVLAIAERIRHLAAAPLEIDGRELIVTASVGIAITQSPDVAPADLLRDADAAKYQAKQAGRDRSVIFADSMRARAIKRLDTEVALRRAIADGELRLHYQPVVNIKTGRADGVEALVRWQHPTRGLIYPDQFITIAEETGLVVPLGEWVLDEACQQLQRWHRKHPQLAHLAVGVNLSGHQLSRPGFPRVVADVLSATGLSADHLILEITESVLMADAEAAVKVLRALKALGVLLSVDDFGTGYSSLSYLKKFPVDALKIDKSFVDGLGTEADDSAIVHAIINLAHTLRLITVAEGTETVKQLTALTDLGCDDAQGYLLSRPKPAAELIETLLHPHWSDHLDPWGPSRLAPTA